MHNNILRKIKTHKKILGKLIPVIFYALLVIFLVFYLQSIDLGEIKNASLNWWFILIASILGLSARYWAVFIWFVLLNGLGATGLKKVKGQLIYVYAKSWLGRYIPGSATWILGKIYFASKHGVSRNKLAVSSLLEGGLQVAVVMAVAFSMLIFDSRLDVINIWLKLGMVIVLVVCIIAMLPPVFNRIIAVAYRLLKKKTIEKEHLASGKTIGKGVLLFVVSSFITGTALFFIAKSVDPSLSSHNWFFVMGAANLAGAASMLAVFAPSGLGVREGIQLVLFSLIMPKELALIVVVITRLWSVAIDFAFFGLSKFIAIFVFKNKTS